MAAILMADTVEDNVESEETEVEQFKKRVWADFQPQVKEQGGAEVPYLPLEDERCWSTVCERALVCFP